MRNVSGNSCRENKNIHFLSRKVFLIYFLFKGSRAIRDIVEADRLQVIVWRMRIAYWISKATNTHSEYVILIACPRQQWLPERVPVLSYRYVTCLVFLAVSSSTYGSDERFVVNTGLHTFRNIAFVFRN